MVGVGPLVRPYISRVSLVWPAGTVALVGRVAPRHSLAFSRQFRYVRTVALVVVVLIMVVAFRTPGLLLLTEVLPATVLTAMLLVGTPNPRGPPPILILSALLAATAYRLNVMVLSRSAQAMAMLVPLGIPVTSLFPLPPLVPTLLLLPRTAILVPPMARAQSPAVGASLVVLLVIMIGALVV